MKRRDEDRRRCDSSMGGLQPHHQNQGRHRGRNRGTRCRLRTECLLTDLDRDLGAKQAEKEKEAAPGYLRSDLRRLGFRKM
jgi:hypothetical protein